MWRFLSTIGKKGSGKKGGSVQNLTKCPSRLRIPGLLEEALQFHRQLCIRFRSIKPAQLLAHVRRAAHRPLFRDRKSFLPIKLSCPPPDRPRPEILPAPPRPFRKISAEDRLTLPPPRPGVAHPPPSPHPSRTSWVRPNFSCCRSSSTASIRHPIGPPFSGSTSSFNKLPKMAPKGEAR